MRIFCIQVRGHSAAKSSYDLALVSANGSRRSRLDGRMVTELRRPISPALSRPHDIVKTTAAPLPPSSRSLRHEVARPPGFTRRPSDRRAIRLTMKDMRLICGFGRPYGTPAGPGRPDCWADHVRSHQRAKTDLRSCRSASPGTGIDSRDRECLGGFDHDRLLRRGAGEVPTSGMSSDGSSRVGDERTGRPGLAVDTSRASNPRRTSSFAGRHDSDKIATGYRPSCPTNVLLASPSRLGFRFFRIEWRRFGPESALVFFRRRRGEFDSSKAPTIRQARWQSPPRRECLIGEVHGPRSIFRRTEVMGFRGFVFAGARVDSSEFVPSRTAGGRESSPCRRHKLRECGPY